MDVETKPIYEFGPYRLDAVKRVLRKAGDPVPLTPKAFDTLLTLVENRGNVVEKDDMMRRLWPDSFVEEGNLTVNISVLRKALGESPNNHRYIVTVPGRGYRFVENVRELLEDGSALVVQEHASTRVVIEEEELTTKTVRGVFLSAIASLHRLHLSHRLAVVSVVLILLVASGLYWRLSARPKSQSHFVSLSSLQMTQLSSWKMEPAEPATFPRFSRDGRMIAFSSTKSGHSNIWIKQVVGGEAIPITTGDWTDLTPIWSPDNQQIAFMSDRGNQYGIWMTPALGGPLVLLKANVSTFTKLRYWSRDGQKIYYVLDHNLFALDVASKEIIQVTNFNPATSHSRDFSISPGEDRIVYADSVDGQFDIWVMSITGGRPTPITNDKAEDKHPVWHPDGNRIIYTSNRVGAFQLCIAYLDGDDIEQITFGDSDALVPDVSPHGDSIIYNSIKEESDIWCVKPDGQDTEFTSDIGPEFWPDVSPDGKTVLFQAGGGSERLSGCSIITKPIAAAGKQLQMAAEGFDPKWSPSGNTVAFLRLLDGQCNIWLTNAAGGEPNPLTHSGISYSPYSMFPYNRAETGGYSWSPDGKRIAYCSSKSGEANIWVASVDGSADFRISNNTNSQLAYQRPVWSSDATRIFSIVGPRAGSIDENSTWQLWTNDRQDSEVTYNSHAYLRLVASSLSEKTVFLTSDENKEKSGKPIDLQVLEVPIDGGSQRSIAVLKLAYANNIRLSPNGKFIAFVSHADGRDNVWIIPATGGEGTKLTTNTDPRRYLSSLTWSPDSTAIYYGKQSKSSIVSNIDNFK